MKKILLLCVISSITFALAVDEKLTMRFLDVSQSKKTVLINRGLEDGLVVGDHAKFFITTGVIARGVVVKASPSRSIWSIYRIVSPDSVGKNIVANIKIATPVKLTEDRTKSIRALVQVNPEMGEPADILPGGNNQLDEQKEIGALLSDTEPSAQSMPVVMAEQSHGSIKSRNSLEIFGTFNFNSMTGTYNDADGNEVDAEFGSMNFSAGIEKYFTSSNSWLSNFSIKGFFANNSQTLTLDTTATQSWMDYGLGVSYYFSDGPFVLRRPLLFVDVNGGMSSMSIETTETIEGSGQFFSMGIGAKYILSSKFGALIKLEYYKVATTFDIEDETSNETLTEEYTVSGPRILAGLVFRFM